MIVFRWLRSFTFRALLGLYVASATVVLRAVFFLVLLRQCDGYSSRAEPLLVARSAWLASRDVGTHITQPRLVNSLAFLRLESSSVPKPAWCHFVIEKFTPNYRSTTIYSLTHDH